MDNDVKVYFECCCEYDRITVEQDNANARRMGYVEISNGCWVKLKKKKEY
jgi:hypothetical protein